MIDYVGKWTVRAELPAKQMLGWIGLPTSKYHLWRQQNIACVDWSVAKGGFLCAYRWDREQTLADSKFAWTVNAMSNP